MASHWLMKSEPQVYSIEDLEKEGRTYWEGVRNYQARNMMRDKMAAGDPVLFYHSNSKPPGVVGVARVVKEAYADHTSWETDNRYFDPKSTPETPRWFMVDIAFEERFHCMVTLDQIKNEPRLEEMVLVRRSRLSVQPVEPAEFELIVKIGRE